MRAGLATVAALLILAMPRVDGASTSQDQQGQFRTTGRTVPVYVSVIARDGQPIVGLTADDFEILDNGKPQEIVQFTAENVPLSALTLMDGSSSMARSFDRVIEGSSSFILRMLPADRARIGSFAERLQLSPGFTSDRDELLAYLADEFNLVLGVATHLWDSMAQGVLALDDEQGKRVLLVLSDGFNWVAPGAARLPPGAVPLGLPRGRGRPGQPPTGTPGLPTGLPPGGMPSGGPTTSEADVLRLAARHDVIVYAISMWVWFDGKLQRPNDTLKRLALESGGGYYELEEDTEVNSTFTEIARELRQGYALGFSPQTLDGKTHSLEVRVKGRNATVRARRSYVADPR